MIIKNGKPYAEIPEGTGRIGRFTTWLQIVSQKPLGVYKPLVAIVGPARTKDASWKLLEAWRGWYYKTYTEEERLFRNGVFFFRLAAPFLIAFSLRWSEKKDAKHLDFVFGYRPNGVFGVSFRFQTDASSEAGYDIPNLNQAKGWNEGWR